jgi:hypothetical protein
MHADLELLPTWVLEQKATANRQVIAVMRKRLAAGEAVARMIKNLGWHGWSAKPRSPRTWSPNARQTAGPTDLGSERRLAAMQHRAGPRRQIRSLEVAGNRRCARRSLVSSIEPIPTADVQGHRSQERWSSQRQLGCRRALCSPAASAVGRSVVAVVVRLWC